MNQRNSMDFDLTTNFEDNNQNSIAYAKVSLDKLRANLTAMNGSRNLPPPPPQFSTNSQDLHYNKINNVVSSDSHRETNLNKSEGDILSNTKHPLPTRFAFQSNVDATVNCHVGSSRVPPVLSSFQFESLPTKSKSFHKIQPTSDFINLQHKNDNMTSSNTSIAQTSFNPYPIGRPLRLTSSIKNDSTERIGSRSQQASNDQLNQQMESFNGEGVMAHIYPKNNGR